MIDHDERTTTKQEIVITITVDDPWSGRGHEHLWMGQHHNCRPPSVDEPGAWTDINNVDIHPSSRSMMFM